MVQKDLARAVAYSPDRHNLALHSDGNRGMFGIRVKFELRRYRVLHRCAVVEQGWTSAVPRRPVPLRRRTSAAQGAPGHDTGMPALVDHHLAIDNDVLDTDRELLGLGTRGRSFDVLGIKDDDIGLESIT